ncbi:MAG TPA: hypothetical protein VGQ69_11775 [Gemmatimonadales bacterium]|jgi:hypothetical protein|nr:hypothetical protein [Gemmatimonadales bacterium]
MYRACLFCHGDLGQNEVVEHLPIGRRLAFDAGKGRLWVVCRKCERWNLTPFDDRWEAIEECEKLFRGTTLRLSTDEIGLARLREGTELVRIGEPLRPEFAAWRYGDQFGRRRVRHFLLVSAGVAGLAGLVFAPKLIGLSIGGGGLYNVINPMLQLVKAKRTVARLPLEQGVALPVTQLQIENTRVSAQAAASSWRLHIPPRRKTNWGRKPKGGDLVILEGAPAHQALQKILPRVNRQGASKEQLKEAVRVLEESPSTDSLASRLTATPGVYWKKKAGLLQALPPELRLALEMGAHEDAERRWLAGELLELEEAWRAAEELAAIADRLGLPEEVEARLAALRSETAPLAAPVDG